MTRVRDFRRHTIFQPAAYDLYLEGRQLWGNLRDLAELAVALGDREAAFDYLAQADPATEPGWQRLRDLVPLFRT